MLNTNLNTGRVARQRVLESGRPSDDEELEEYE
jgi:hypothetical protein